MPQRYLFGPVNPTFARENLARQRQSGACRAFDPDGATDLAIRPGDTWAQVCARLPAGWKPDFIVLYLPYSSSIPACLWSAPVPLIGLAPDWTLLWHDYRRRLRACDLVLTDPPGVEALVREGIHQARPANLYGCEQAFLDTSSPAATAGETRPGNVRDLDILFAGNLNPAVQRQRLPWLARLAPLAKRWRVSIQAGVFGDAYRRLLQRARIVVDFVAQRRCSRRAFEAAASGALLFEHVDNTEVAAFFQDRQECVFYDTDNLEVLLEHYLEHEDERQALAEAGRLKAQHCGFADFWDGILDRLAPDWPALRDRARRRPLPGKRDELFIRGWQALNAPGRSDPTLVHELEAALEIEPHSAPLRNALGLALTRLTHNPAAATAVAEVAAEQFRQAVAANPAHIVARINAAEALEAAGNKEGAIEQARQTLAALERLPELDPAFLDAGPFHADFGLFRVEWERAAWTNAGCPRAEAQAKRDLLRWRLHALLGKLTGDLVHYYEAFLARPDLPASPAALGCTLASRNYPLEALSPLRRALTANPFDREAARALLHVLGVLGDREGQAALCAERRLLSRAAPQPVPAEPWFSEPAPNGRELTSIVILCCNELEYTRLCLESVLRSTRSPYELILVDNASSDGTPAYLEEIRRRPGPARVEVIRNDTNLGFPAGCNQGLARARGRFLVFLNNDTVVTSAWLDGLIAWCLRDWPSVGAVGAVSNYAPDAQGVRGDYATLDGLEQFAARRRQGFAGRLIDVRRLTGFCLLVRRDVLERIGGFDERYALGFFDDDDLCLRAREAGFRLLIAQDVYIHHFGSRTFKGLGLDNRELLLQNFDRFRDKWGAEQVAGYRLPPPSTEPSADGTAADPLLESFTAGSSAGEAAAAVPTRPTVSLCMIVKNEEARLPACLESAADLFGEVVVVDTGSSDRTKEVAALFGAKVADFPWADSFSAARNECLRHATGQWIMWLDADDRLDADNRARLRDLFASLGDELAAYAMKVRSVLDAAGSSFRLLDQVRLFPNHPQVRWEYRVHEQTLPAVNRQGGHVRWTDIVVDHVGYQDVSVRRGKLERNLRLLEMDAAERSDDAFTLFNFGWTLLDLGRTHEALGRLQRSLELSAMDSSIVRKLYHLLVVAHRQLGQGERALPVCREGLGHFPDDTELLLEESLLLLDAKDFGRAEINLLQLLETKPGPYFGSVDDGVRGYRTRHLLAGQYLEQGRYCEAEIQLRAAVGERPSFVPALLALGELYLKQSRWTALDRIAHRLETEAGKKVEAAILGARAHQARGDFPAARRLLEEILPSAPQAVGPRVLLSHVLLQDGSDLPAAEQVLHDILTLDPGNAEAQHNLAILQRKQQLPVSV